MRLHEQYEDDLKGRDGGLDWNLRNTERVRGVRLGRQRGHTSKKDVDYAVSLTHSTEILDPEQSIFMPLT